MSHPERFTSPPSPETGSTPPELSTSSQGACGAAPHGHTTLGLPPGSSSCGADACFPRRLGRYVLERELGRGGMGTVYLAHDTQLDRRVALKVPRLPAERTNEFLQRFYREARAAAGLRHPEICAVFDVGEVEGLHHITMAYIEGQSLAQLISTRGPLNPRQAVTWVRQLAQALQVAHQHGVVHRDLKPANIMIERGDHPVIMDFGLALCSDREDPGLTVEGAFLGTLAYASPEQVEAETSRVGSASDIYSLGAVLYELLTGRRTFQGDARAVLAGILTASPQPPSSHRADLDAALDVICLTALARQPAQRFASMAEFAETLDAYLRDGRAATSATLSAEHAVFERAESMFQRWGWGMAASRIQEEAESAVPAQRAIWSDLSVWLKDDRKVDRELARRWRRTPLNRWRLIGQAFDALRKRRYESAGRLLDQIELPSPSDPVLEANVLHCRGVLLQYQGQTSQALQHLHASLERVGRDHFLGGRILDTLGKAYAAANNFLAAREFYEQAIRAKQRHDDQPGLAVTHGQLGRLFLDWGDLDAAEEHFRTDLQLAEQLADLRATAMMYNHLGQIYLCRCQLDEAVGYLDESLHLCQQYRFVLEEGFVRKDRALVNLRLGQLELAEEDLRIAEAVFQERRFEEGLAHVRRTRAALLSEQGEGRAAEELLRRAAAWFDQSGEISESARCWLELAGVRRQRKSPARLVTDALLTALQRAELCGRNTLIREIEGEIHEADAAMHLRQAYRRLRGRDFSRNDASLQTARSEIATALAFELIDAAQFVRSANPEVVVATFNQLYFELAPVLEKHRLMAMQYSGDGLIGLSLGSQHAHRAVACGVEILGTLEEFNRPRRVLGLPEFVVGIGVSSGPVVLGNLGTYRKIDATAVGRPVKVAGLLKSEAKSVWISQSTYELVRTHFEFTATEARHLSVPGIGNESIWCVTAAVGGDTRPLGPDTRGGDRLG